jgi:hypothetical protein
MAKKTGPDLKQIAGLLKKGLTPRQVKNELGLPASDGDPAIWAAEPIADPSLKFKATSKSVVKARDDLGLRWERIAIRADISVSEAKKMYKEGGGDLDKSWTGRGKPPAGVDVSKNGKKSAKGKKAGKAVKGKAAPTKRARTRAQRAAKKRGAANPS